MQAHLDIACIKRLTEHAQSVVRGDNKSALSKHRKSNHPNIVIESVTDVAKVFEAKIIKSGVRFNTQRYIQEAIQIEKINRDTSVRLLNSRAEWGNNRVRRLRNG